MSGNLSELIAGIVSVDGQEAPVWDAHRERGLGGSRGGARRLSLGARKIVHSIDSRAYPDYRSGIEILRHRLKSIIWKVHTESCLTKTQYS